MNCNSTQNKAPHRPIRPWADPAEAQHEYGLTPVATPSASSYDGIVLAVAHEQFKEIGAQSGGQYCW